MDNHSEQITQYAKLETLYSTIIYLQKEVVKEQDKLEQLKKEDKNGNPCYNFWDIEAEHPRTAVNYTVTKA